MALLDFPSGPSAGQTYGLNGNTWQWNGTSWIAFNSLSLTSQVTGILAVQYGGTGFGGTYTVGDILYASSSNTFTKLSAGTAGSVLASGGPATAPYWKLDAQGSGSVGNGNTYGFAYYDTLNTITSGTAYSYISSTNNVVLTNGLLSLTGSTINSGTWAGTAISLPYGGTNNTLSGVGQSYRLAMYDAAGAAITTITTNSGIANSVLFQVNNSSAPYWVGQSSLVVGGATTAGVATSTSDKVNITKITGSGVSYLYFGDVVSGYATIGATADITVQASSGTIYAKFFSGTATSAAQVNTDQTTATRYLVGTVLNTASGSTQLSTGSGITFTGSLLTTAGLAVTANTASTSTSTGALVVSGGVGIGGSLWTATGNTSSVSGVVHYNSVITSGVWAGTAISLSNGGTNNNLSGVGQSYRLAMYDAAGAAITSITTNSGIANSVLFQVNNSSAPYWVGPASFAVTSISASQGISVSTSSGTATVGNIGATSVVAGSNSISISASGTGGTGRITIDTAQNITTSGTPQFDTISVRAGSLTTTSFTSATDIVNKQYVDNLASGLDIHGSVRAIAVSGLGASYFQSAIGGTNDATGAYLVSTTQVALPNIDGVAFGSTGVTQRVLVTGGIDGKVNIGGTGWQASTGISYLANGIYYVTNLGAAGTANWILTRATDTDTSTELTAGTFTFIEEGTSYGDTGWVCTNDTTNLGPIGFGITQISFSQFTGAAAFNVGQGLNKTGNTIASKINLSSTGTASGVGFTQFNIGGASVGGVADTGYYPTFSVRTSGTIAGSATLTLNSDGFSLVGSTNTNRTVTVTGSDITLTGGGNTLTLTGSISLPAPTQYGVAYGSNTTAVAFLTAAGSGASILSQTSGSAPVYLAQSQLVVGGASTAAQWQTARTVTFSGGGITGSFTIDGSANVTGVAITNLDNSIALGTKTSGQYASTITINGTGISATSAAADDGTAYIIYSSATNANTASAIVQRDSSGNFTAGTITANLTGTASIATSVATTTDTANTLYLLGSRTSTGVAATAIFVDTNVSVTGNTITATNFSGLASSSTKVGITTFVGAGTSYLYFGDVASGYATIGATTDITVQASSGTITAKSFSGLATSSTRVGITTSVSSSDLPIVFSDVHQPYAALGSSTLLTYQASSGKITNGIWAGTAVTTKYGGTGLQTVNANDILIGAASGNTWTSIGSSLVPVAAIGSTPPAQPGGAIGGTQPGQLWWDSTYGVLKIYYTDQAAATTNSQWVDATPVLGSSGGGSATKRSYVMTFGAGFTPSTGADTVQILVPYAPDNTSKYYYIKRLDYRANTAGTGVSFYMERFTGGNAAFDTTGNRIHSASGASFEAKSGGTFITSYTLSSSGASFVSSTGVAGSVISGDYLRLNFTHINSAATMSVSILLEEQ